MSKKNVVITGANRGIGFELTRQLLAKSYACYGLCRQTSSDLSGTSAVVIDKVDVTDLNSIQAVCDQLPDQIDILINFAGFFSLQGLDDLSTSCGLEEMDRQFQVNSLGPLRVTAVLRDKLVSGSKVVMITSRMGSVDDNDSGSSYGYRMSKTALNSASKSLAIDLKPHEIAVGIFHPGWVRTDMTGGTGHLDASESAALLIERVEALALSNSGVFFHANGDVLPW